MIANETTLHKRPNHEMTQKLTIVYASHKLILFPTDFLVSSELNINIKTYKARKSSMFSNQSYFNTKNILMRNIFGSAVYKLIT